MNGFANVTIAEITGRADVALGSFYNHFDNREAMVHAVLAESKRTQQIVRAHVDEQLGGEGYGPIVGILVSFVHRAAIDPEFADLCRAALLAGYWPDPEQSVVLTEAVRSAAEAADTEVIVPYASAAIKWLVAAMIDPDLRAHAADLGSAVEHVVAMGLRLIGASPADVELWSRRALETPIDLSILDL